MATDIDWKKIANLPETVAIQLDGRQLLPISKRQLWLIG